MGGLSRRSSSASLSPPAPSLSPRIIEDEEEDPVPLFFLDDSGALSAGIEDSPSPSSSSRSSIPDRHPPRLRRRDATMGSTFSSIASLPTLSHKKKMSNLSLPSAMRKSSSSLTDESASSSGKKLKKLVRFLDRVEVVPAYPLYHCRSPEPETSNKKQKMLGHDADSPANNAVPEFDESLYDIRDAEYDEAITSGLGRAGSPRGSPNRSPNSSTRDLTSIPEADEFSLDHLMPPPRVEHAYITPPSSPPSWRIPPETLRGLGPHVREPPRVRSPTNPDEEIDLHAQDYERPRRRDSGCSLGDSEAEREAESNEPGFSHEEQVRPGVSYISPSPSSPPRSPRAQTLHPVIARKMWPHGEIRFEDQWGRRLVPAGHRDSFRFDLWPVDEDVRGEGLAGSVRGAWVKGRDGVARRARALRSLSV